MLLISIKSEWVRLILTGFKTVEVRKQFPIDYRGKMYIYCTKRNPTLIECNNRFTTIIKKSDALKINNYNILNGCIIGSVIIDNVRQYSIYKKDGRCRIRGFTDKKMNLILNCACVSVDDVYRYCDYEERNFILITFKNLVVYKKPDLFNGKAPQSWRYLKWEEIQK